MANRKKYNKRGIRGKNTNNRGWANIESKKNIRKLPCRPNFKFLNAKLHVDENESSVI